MSGFELIVAGAAFLAGAIASVAGFGIGSILTPLLATQLGTKLAVAAVSIPHLTGTLLRFWMLRDKVDRRVLLTFGVTSAAGGLAGALLHSVITTRALTYILAALLIFTGAVNLAGKQIRFGHRMAWVAGAVSGLLGGLVGNQGGIRAGAMLGFDVPKEAFVATATAIGLVVDGVRMPVYLASEGAELLKVAPLIAIATVGVVAGTLLGKPLLGRIPDRTFRTIIAVLLIALGVTLAI
jgi:uncharacterized membrane protein YfcA